MRGRRSACRTCSGTVKTARNKAESAESNSSSSALKSDGRKFDRFALFRMVCNLLASSALINPRQEGLAYVVCTRRVARATSHSAGPLRPSCKRFQSIERRGCFGSYTSFTCGPQDRVLLKVMPRAAIWSTLVRLGTRDGRLRGLFCFFYSLGDERVPAPHSGGPPFRGPPFRTVRRKKFI